VVTAGSLDILGLEWTTFPSRDRVSATLVCNYLAMQGLTVRERSIWDAYHEIHRVRAALLFMTNTIGAVENIDAMRYAKRRNMLGVSLLSEGNFQGDEAYQREMIWGWNKDRFLYEDVHMQWSTRTRDMTLTLYPELEGRVKVSGGVGFDNYQIEKRDSIRRGFLRRHGKERYERVIGVGCWDFGCVYPQETRYQLSQSLLGPEQCERFRSDGLAFDRELDLMIKSNPGILFILKEHPGSTLGYLSSGITQSAQNPNVLILKHEEPILTCIQVSDLWMVYESTTAMEAWLLGKTTFLLNPSGREFKRDKLNEGSPSYETAQGVQQLIDAYYAGAAIKAFDERASKREMLVRSIIQWSDGLNHVRAGNEILDLIEQRKRESWQSENVSDRIARFRQHAKWELGPTFRRSKNFLGSYANKNNFSLAELAAYKKLKQSEQTAYYEKLGLSLVDLRQIRCI